MSLKSLVLALACLAVASGSRAEGARFGASVDFPVPACDVGDKQLGVDVGLMLEQMANRHVGIGIETMYHYWPVSSEYMAAYDSYLRSWFETFDGTRLGFSVVQVTLHLKAVGPTVRGGVPWVQVGGGCYYVDRNIAATNWDGSPILIQGGDPEHTAILPGGYCSAGVDFRTSSRMALGLHATYQVLESEGTAGIWGSQVSIPSFSAFTIGTHVVFGR